MSHLSELADRGGGKPGPGAQPTMSSAVSSHRDLLADGAQDELLGSLIAEDPKSMLMMKSLMFLPLEIVAAITKFQEKLGI